MRRSGSMKGTLVSVIVPVYNVLPYLRKCIDSILAQTYSNLEIILVDDGSTDGSGAVCDEYAEVDLRIKVLHKENGGLSSARNSGLDVATGDWISFVDSDDYIEKTMIQTLFESCCNNNIPLAVTGIRAFDNETGQTVSTYIPEAEKIVTSSELIELMMRPDGAMFSVCNKMYRRELWYKYRFPVGRNWEDVAINYKVVDEAQKAVLVKGMQYCYRQRKGSIVHSSIDMYSDFEKSTKESIDWISSVHPELNDPANAYYIRALLFLLSESAKSSNVEYYNIIRLKFLSCMNQNIVKKYLNKKEKIKVFLVRHGVFFFAWRFYINSIKNGSRSLM